MDFDFYAIGTIFLRFSNALLWSWVTLRIIQFDEPVPRLIRSLIVTVLIFGMWVLAMGSLTQIGLSGEFTRQTYTIFTVYAGIAAIAILLTDRDEVEPDAEGNHRDPQGGPGSGHQP